MSGSIIRASPDELGLQWQTPLSVHQSGLRELLQHAASLSPSPEIVILGIVPENTDSPGMNLSKTVEGVIDRVISDVSALISA